MLFRSQKDRRRSARQTFQIERPVPGRGRQGKGGLRATGCSFGNSGTRNLNGDVNPQTGCPHHDMRAIDPGSGDVATRLKSKGSKSKAEEVAGDVRHDGDSRRGGKPKWNLRQVNGFGGTRTTGKTDNGTSYESGPGLTPWTDDSPRTDRCGG